MRYSSSPLLNTILLSELEQIHSAGRLLDVLSNVSLDSEIISATSPESSNWNERLAERHDWQTLADVDTTFGGATRGNVHGSLTQSAKPNRCTLTLPQAFNFHATRMAVT